MGSIWFDIVRVSYSSTTSERHAMVSTAVKTLQQRICLTALSNGALWLGARDSRAQACLLGKLYRNNTFLKF